MLGAAQEEDSNKTRSMPQDLAHPIHVVPSYLPMEQEHPRPVFGVRAGSRWLIPPPSTTRRGDPRLLTHGPQEHVHDFQVIGGEEWRFFFFSSRG